MEKSVREIWVSDNTAANGVVGANTSLRTSSTDHTWKTGINVGDIYITNDQFATLTTNNLSNKIYIVNKLPNGVVKRSHPISLQGVTSVKKEGYAAKVNLVKAAGYSTASTTQDLPRVFGKTYKLVIDVKTEFRTAYNRTFQFDGGVFTYNVSASVTGAALDTANAAFYQQFVDAINNSPVSSKYVTAALVNNGGAAGLVKYGITITGKSIAFKLQTPLQILAFDMWFQDTLDINSAGVITTVTALVRGSGTYEQVANAEWLIQGNRGLTNFGPGFPTDVPLIYATASGTYTLYSIEGFNMGDGGLGVRVKQPFSHVIAVNSNGGTNTSTLITALELMLAPLTTPGNTQNDDALGS